MLASVHRLRIFPRRRADAAACAVRSHAAARWPRPPPSRGTPLSCLDRGDRLASACKLALGDTHPLTDVCRRQRRSELSLADCGRGIGGAEPRRQGVWGIIPPCGNSWRKTSPSLARKGGRGRRLAPHEPYHHHRQIPSTPLPIKPRQRSGATAGVTLVTAGVQGAA